MSCESREWASEGEKKKGMEAHARSMSQHLARCSKSMVENAS